jgi:hypothetical protein
MIQTKNNQGESVFADFVCGIDVQNRKRRVEILNPAY